MSEDAAAEKKHAPSAKRLEELGKQGQTMRSRDLAGGLIFFTNIMILLFMVKEFYVQFAANFTQCFTAIQRVLIDQDFPGHLLSDLASKNFYTMMPLLVLAFLAAFLSPFLFGGWNFSLSAVGFKWEKLGPMKFFKNNFSSRIFIEIARSLVKVLIIFGVLLFYVSGRKGAFYHLAYLPTNQGISIGLSLVKEFIEYLCFGVALVIVTDMIYHYYEFQNKNKMTLQELKDESKDTDGSPEMKRKIRQTQFALMKQRLNQTVPQATVIITNPTHYAVALRYDEGKDNAPKIVAKGKDYIAQQIRQIAIANAVPIYQAPPLARAIYHTGDIGTTIHPDLYMGVAIVLSYVNQLRHYQQGLGQLPSVVDDLQIPKELHYDE